MIDVEKLVRTNILQLKPYSSARDDYKGSTGVFLDANENPYGKLNRYPDPYQAALKEKLSKLKKIPVQNIFIGNGSDEVIDLAIRIFCTPGKDKVLLLSPTYGMYAVCAVINDVEIINVPLDSSFQINSNELNRFIADASVKIIFICSPNNPTGNSINGIQYVLDHFKGIVFVDEAYIDFSKEKSWISQTKKYSNLIVSQTFSKAWGLAAARVGTAYASAEIINLFNKIKYPYNISFLNQKAALNALCKQKLFKKRKNIILSEKDKMKSKLLQFPFIKIIYPSDANFLLVAFTEADIIYDFLINEKIITRNRNTVVKDCIRITIGTRQENKILINALKRYNEKDLIS
ncbi:MAG: histidinol-phosphate transaminase [Ferruginibacter sp.]